MKKSIFGLLLLLGAIGLTTTSAQNESQASSLPRIEKDQTLTCVCGKTSIITRVTHTYKEELDRDAEFDYGCDNCRRLWYTKGSDKKHIYERNPGMPHSCDKTCFKDTTINNTCTIERICSFGYPIEVIATPEGQSPVKFKLEGYNKFQSGGRYYSFPYSGRNITKIEYSVQDLPVRTKTTQKIAPKRGHNQIGGLRRRTPSR